MGTSTAGWRDSHKFCAVPGRRGEWTTRPVETEDGTRARLGAMSWISRQTAMWSRGQPRSLTADRDPARFVSTVRDCAVPRSLGAVRWAAPIRLRKALTFRRLEDSLFNDALLSVERIGFGPGRWRFASSEGIRAAAQHQRSSHPDEKRDLPDAPIVVIEPPLWTSSGG